MRKPNTSEPAPHGVGPGLGPSARPGHARALVGLALGTKHHPQQRHGKRSRHAGQEHQRGDQRFHCHRSPGCSGERPACATLTAPTPSTLRTGALMNTPAVRQTDEYVAGQLLGTQAAIRALILLHPDPTSASRFVAQELERWIAHGLASTATNDWQLQGISAATKAVIPSEQDLRRADPDRP